MSKKKKAFILLLVLVIVAGAVILLFHRDNAEYVDATQKDEVRWAYELLSGALSSSDIMYCDYLAYAKEEDGTGSFTAGEGQTQVLSYRQSAEYTVNVEAAGWYYIKLDYMAAGNNLSDFSADIKINGEQAYYEMKTIGIAAEIPVKSRGEQNTGDECFFGWLGARRAYRYGTGSRHPFLRGVPRGAFRGTCFWYV